ncbi:hypothetical protein LshimejAT787_0605730 [Lyophyllum shimeji]|uniref:Uncharacterized protein n=1 Tax=Lyophyllum shimeji TaxID=47721 RepID=A0A9P3PPI8_LYOSH|nr:hypothetical protein LshimejAT787_0605730 [Lyophyllum shimeji]
MLAQNLLASKILGRHNVECSAQGFRSREFETSVYDTEFSATPQSVPAGTLSRTPFPFFPGPLSLKVRGNAVRKLLCASRTYVRGSFTVAIACRDEVS